MQKRKVSSKWTCKVVHILWSLDEWRFLQEGIVSLLYLYIVLKEGLKGGNMFLIAVAALCGWSTFTCTNVLATHTAEDNLDLHTICRWNLTINITFYHLWLKCCTEASLVGRGSRGCMLPHCRTSWFLLNYLGHQTLCEIRARRFARSIEFWSPERRLWSSDVQPSEFTLSVTTSSSSDRVFPCLAGNRSKKLVGVKLVLFDASLNATQHKRRQTFSNHHFFIIDCASPVQCNYLLLPNSNNGRHSLKMRVNTS